jgi:HD-GYP domain-containing protein (c-di-GMP phosphodiesterase class II)
MDGPAILIVDADPNIKRDLSGSLPPSVRVEFADNQKNAQLIIAAKDQRFSAFCINSNVCDPSSIPLVRFAKIHHPATPVCLLFDPGSNALDAEYREKLQIHHCLQKPFQASDLINSIFPFSLMEVEKLIQNSGNDDTAINADVEKNDSGMHAISARDFLCGSKCFFDIYIQLSSGKYLKILKGGDQFEPSRVKSYLDKGVTNFYMKKEAQDFFLQYCDKITEAILAKPELSIEVKVDQVINFAKETTDYLKSRGCSELTLHSSQQFIRHACQLTKQLQPSVLDLFLQKAALCEHGAGSVMLVSMLLSELGYHDPKVRDLIALGAMYHDIGLLKSAEKFQTEDESSFSDAEIVEYEEHPIVGAELLKSIKRLNPLLPLVVLQHHERRSRNGFPYRLGPEAISPVAELIGIVDIFHHLIGKAAKDPTLNPNHEMEKHHFNSFSAKLVVGFQKVFPDKSR